MKRRVGKNPLPGGVRGGLSNVACCKVEYRKNPLPGGVRGGLKMLQEVSCILKS